MSLPAETKFPCSVMPCDALHVDFEDHDAVIVSTYGPIGVDSRKYVCLDRDQIESLREQLSAWLAETGDA